MKKLYILIFIVSLSLISEKSFAQKFNAGAIVGPTFCQVDGDHYAGFHQVGVTAGFFANLPFDDHWSGQMELKYSLFGAHSSAKEVTEYYYEPYNFRIHYAEIPLMVRCNLGYFKIKGVSLDFITLEAGASMDIRLHATENVNGDFQVTTSRWSLFSATANAGLHFAIGKHFGIGGRFMYSIAPMRFTGNPGWFFNQYYNKVIQITMTYTIYSPLK